MRIVLIIGVLAILWHCQVFAGNFNISNSSFIPGQKTNLTKNNQISGLDISEKVMPEYTRFTGMLSKTTYANPPDTSDPNIILQGGDTISDATVITSLPFNDNGTTTGYTDNYDEACPYMGFGAPDVVYKISCVSDMWIDIDLYGSAYDTKLYIYEDAVTPASPYACNDDYYDDYTSALLYLRLNGGHSYYIVIDGYGNYAGDYNLAVVECEGPANLCPEASVHSQPAHLPTDQWTGLTSDYGFGDDLTVFDNFELDESTSVSGIQFWGFDMQFNGDWADCFEDPITFEIVFYSDNGGIPGTVLATYRVISSPMATGLTYLGSELNKYYVNLEPTLTAIDGWISIRGISEPPECMFLWLSSSRGLDNTCFQLSEGQLYPTAMDRAFCLIGGEGGPEICEQSVISPGGDWNFLCSDNEVGPNVVYENFTCENLEGIDAVRFWGLDIHDDGGWYECNENPTEFEIRFYPNIDSLPDIANPYCSFTIVPQRINTAVYYDGIYELIDYYAEFEHCDINTGWVSIQGTLNDGNACVFFWGCSEDGDMMSYQYQNGSPVQQAYDLSFELYGSQTSIENVELLPAQFDMLTNYPNPFNAQTTIAFSLKESGNVSIDIFDVLGRRIDRLEMGYLNNTQVHTVSYDAGNLATGVYFYSLMVNGEKRASERFSLLK